MNEIKKAPIPSHPIPSLKSEKSTCSENTKEGGEGGTFFSLLYFQTV